MNGHFHKSSNHVFRFKVILKFNLSMTLIIYFLVDGKMVQNEQISIANVKKSKFCFKHSNDFTLFCEGKIVKN